MSPEYEACIKNQKSLSQIRSLAEKNPFIKNETVDSVESAKIMLTDVFQRLHLKEKLFFFLVCVVYVVFCLYKVHDEEFETNVVF